MTGLGWLVGTSKRGTASQGPTGRCRVVERSGEEALLQASAKGRHPRQRGRGRGPKARLAWLGLVSCQHSRSPALTCHASPARPLPLPPLSCCATCAPAAWQHAGAAGGAAEGSAAVCSQRRRGLEVMTDRRGGAGPGRCDASTATGCSLTGPWRGRCTIACNVLMHDIGHLMHATWGKGGDLL